MKRCAALLLVLLLAFSPVYADTYFITDTELEQILEQVSVMEETIILQQALLKEQTEDLKKASKLLAKEQKQRKLCGILLAVSAGAATGLLILNLTR